MPRNTRIIPLTSEQVPTILSYDSTAGKYIIGNEARVLGLGGKTNVFNFKPDLGEGDATFSQKKTYWIAPRFTTEDLRTLSAKEATTFFIQELLRDIKVPSDIIIGEPAERDDAWKNNFRRHMREIFEELYNIKPQFLPEPFAVFQYYRINEQILSAEDEQETILIVDIGGGTFNSCIISTTESGYLARGGAKKVPYGLQSNFCGGSLIDKELLSIVVEKAKKQGIKWKDNPIVRAERSEMPVLLRIEDAKIYLSISIGDTGKLSEDFSHIKTSVSLEKGSLHPDMDINVELTGEDLKTVVRKVWRHHWGELIAKTFTETRKKIDFKSLDKILVAGGSSRLPFMREELSLPLRSLLKNGDIYFGSDTGNAVAFGIACECKEQSRRYPNLGVGRVASCLLNDLYVGIRKTRQDPITLPKKIKSPNGKTSKIGQLLSAPFETDSSKIIYKIDLPFDIENRLFYSFSESPFTDTDNEPVYLNINNDVVSVKPNRHYSKKCELELEFRTDGVVKPTFILLPVGKNAEAERVQCADFYMDNLRIHEGNEYLGIDFGTSNSYVVRFLSVADEQHPSEYPEYKVNKPIMDSLRELQQEIESYGEVNLFEKQSIIQYAKDKILLNVFHSNKIEGSPLTKGETEIFVQDHEKKPLSKQEREAKNLIDAYNWMIEHNESLTEDPQGFIRNINKMILDGVMAGGGEYRQKPVTISGMDFVPPMGATVPAFMQKLTDEIRKGPENRSIVEFSVSMHTKLVSIHPFIDANGRTARLLMNAILLAYNLPVVVVNYDDKQRYLNALSDSNKGDISALVEFIIDCFKHQVDDFRRETSGDSTPKKEDIIILDEMEKDDPIKAAFEEIGINFTEDPLRSIMEQRIKELSRVKEAEYESWKQAFSMILFEMRSIAEAFNGTYKPYAFQMQVIEYDMLSLDKYMEIIQGKKVSKTWFTAIQLSGPGSHIKVLFFFEHAPNCLESLPNINKVVLTLVRFDGTTYQRLISEPITLREIALDNGQLMFFGKNGEPIVEPTKVILKTFLAELIKAYVHVK